MKLERLQLKGFSDAFPGVVDLPFRDIPEGLIAVVGRNGCGKTSLVEASGPAAIYRQLPSRNGEDTVSYARDRDSYIDLEYAIGGLAFRSRLNLDGPKRQTDALLEERLPDGTRRPLNNGQRSTYDVAIREIFPTLDLFITSSFTAQGRGDEFTRRKPSQRKDIVVEALALEHYLVKAKAAGEAAELCDDARRRLESRVDVLERETAQGLLEAIEQQVDRLQTEGSAAAVRKVQIHAAIATLAAREKLASDQVAAYASAQLRVQACDTARAQRDAERVTLTAQRAATLAARDGDHTRIAAKCDADRRSVAGQRTAAETTLTTEQAAIASTRDAEVKELDTKIAGNATLKAQEAAITAAVAALPGTEAELTRVRAELDERRTAQETTAEQLREAERAIAALLPVKQALTRTQADAALLADVPCGGAGAYATCQLLVNAKTAETQIPALEQQLLPKVTLADQIARLVLEAEFHISAIATLQAEVATLETARAQHLALTQYDAALKAHDARVAELTTQRETALRTADEQWAATQARYGARLLELDATDARLLADADTQLRDATARSDARLAEIREQETTLERAVTRLTADRRAACDEVDAAAPAHSAAAQLQADLTAARTEWDQVLTTLATVASGREQLEALRREIAAKREALAETRDRLARLQQELVDWRDLQKALGKGGLPDLALDAAGPGLTALTNTLLASSFDTRFSVQIVTQIQKADGSGSKDEFTVLVLDNEHPQRGWKDLYLLSGGERVVVQEALMCAFAIFVNAQSPCPIRTLWRDESGAALDVENAPRYVRMLRTVREIGGFAHVIFITHNLDAAALADAQVVCGGGTARLTLPPFTDDVAA